MVGGHIHIRLAGPSDVPAILDITREAFAEYARRISPPVPVAALSDTEQSVLEDLAKKRVFIGEFDGKPVGTVRYERFGSLAYVSRFGVLRQAQKGGMGRALSSFVDQDAAEQGVTAFALHTASKMQALMRFYYGCGYYVYSTRHERGYVRALMVKELGDTPLPDLTPILER